MRHLSVLLAAWLAAIGLVLGCTSNLESGSGTGDPTVGDVEQSQCKSDQQQARLLARQLDEGDPEGTGDADGSDLTVGALHYELNGSNVTIYHIDSLCPCDAIMAFDLEVLGNHMTLTEVDHAGTGNECLCRMDLAVTIDGLKQDETYTLDVYNQDHSILFGTLEIRFDNNECPIECVVDSDCWELGLAVPDCAGDFVCVENLCLFECSGDEPTQLCMDDSECPDGYYCQFNDDEGRPDECWDENGEFYCDGDVPSSDGDVQPYGTCVPGGDPTYPGECGSDRDCPRGYFCEFRIGGPEDCYDENGEFYCDGDFPSSDGDVQPYGTCVPGGDPTYPGECGSDQDCPEGMICQFNYDSNGSLPEECWDENGEFYCDGDVPSSDGDVQPYGTCVPVEEPPYYGECRSDWDCPEGLICQFFEERPDECWEDPATGELFCEDYPDAGYCVPVEEPSQPCMIDEECPDGFYCQLPDWGDPEHCRPDENGELVCDPVPDMIGTCAPVEEPPYYGECGDDRDCPEGMICEWFEEWIEECREDPATGETYCEEYPMPVGRCL